LLMEGMLLNAINIIFYQMMILGAQIVTMASALGIVGASISPGLAIHVSLGPHSALTVTGGCLKMLLITRTCVVTRKAVLRMDRGATLLTLKLGGNTATYLDVLLEFPRTLQLP